MRRTPTTYAKRIATPSRGQMSMMAFTTSSAKIVAEIEDLVMNIAEESCMTGMFINGSEELSWYWCPWLKIGKSISLLSLLVIEMRLLLLPASLMVRFKQVPQHSAKATDRICCSSPSLGHSVLFMRRPLENGIICILERMIVLLQICCSCVEHGVCHALL